jgi:hypothetical protein
LAKEEEPKPVGFGKSMGVFSHKRARSTRIRGSASKFDYNEKRRKQLHKQLKEPVKERGRRLGFDV